MLKIEMNKAEFILDLMRLRFKEKRQYISRFDHFTGEEYCEQETRSVPKGRGEA
jgi:phage regulator Rha-like protein